MHIRESSTIITLLVIFAVSLFFIWLFFQYVQKEEVTEAERITLLRAELPIEFLDEDAAVVTGDEFTYDDIENIVDETSDSNDDSVLDVSVNQQQQVVEVSGLSITVDSDDGLVSVTNVVIESDDILETPLSIGGVVVGVDYDTRVVTIATQSKIWRVEAEQAHVNIQNNPVAFVGIREDDKVMVTGRTSDDEEDNRLIADTISIIGIVLNRPVGSLINTDSSEI